MSTKILPHNFQELLEAEIALLEERSFKLLPDFPSGGLMDASEYQKEMERSSYELKSIPLMIKLWLFENLLRHHHGISHSFH